MIRNYRLVPLLLAPLLWASSADAWPLPWYAAGRYDVPPRVYGYPLDDDGAGYYGGSRYKEYYSFGRGYALADFPGPVPNYPQGHWFRPKYWPFGSRELPKVYDPDQYANCAYIMVQVPPDAEVWLEGKTTKQTGATRTYYSPPLPAHQSFVYQLRVRWTDASGLHEQTENVTVQAGAQVQVNFHANGTAGKTEQVSFTPDFRPVPGK
jgi:uncharacterized protein (TIGR03000 family)